MVSARSAGGPYTGRGNFRFSWYGSRIVGQIDAAVQKALDETAAAAKATARSLVRVDTGELRDSIDAVVNATGSGRRRMVLSASARHALWNELGTSRMSAQPFLRPAIDQEAPKLRGRIRAALGSAR